MKCLKSSHVLFHGGVLILLLITTTKQGSYIEDRDLLGREQLMSHASLAAHQLTRAANL